MEQPQRGRRTRVAVIDDDGAFLRGLGRQLNAQASTLDVALATDLDLEVARTFDMLVLDAHLGSDSGLEVCRALRAAGLAVTLVISSSEMTEELAVQAYAAGADFALHKPFAPSTLVELVQKLRSREPAPILDRAALVEEHLDLARNIARRLGRRYSSVLATEDIDGLGMLGLCEAASRYDSSRGEPFVAFAAQRIRGAVIDELRRQSLHSRHGYERKRKIDAVRRAITQDGESPTDDLVAAQLGIPEELVREASEVFTRVPESEVATVASSDDTPDRYVERAQTLAHLANARRTLTPLEATLISMRYDHGMSLATIARNLELSSARVTKILEQGLTRMRSAFDDDS